MDVWVSPRATRFHRKGCRHGWSRSAYEIPVEEITQLPCRRCFPDAPRPPKLRHAYCVICSSRRPCSHNGGIRIVEQQIVKQPSLLHEIGDTITKTRWVWPDSPRALAKLMNPVVK